MGNLYPPPPSFLSFSTYYLISSSIILPSLVSVPLNENRKATSEFKPFTTAWTQGFCVSPIQAPRHRGQFYFLTYLNFKGWEVRALVALSPLTLMLLVTRILPGSFFFFPPILKVFGRVGWYEGQISHCFWQFQTKVLETWTRVSYKWEIKCPQRSTFKIYEKS